METCSLWDSPTAWGSLVSCFRGDSEARTVELTLGLCSVAIIIASATSGGHLSPCYSKFKCLNGREPPDDLSLLLQPSLSGPSRDSPLARFPSTSSHRSSAPWSPPGAFTECTRSSLTPFTRPSSLLDPSVKPKSSRLRE
jgi:hypothetical protein